VRLETVGPGVTPVSLSLRRRFKFILIEVWKILGVISIFTLVAASSAVSLNGTRQRVLRVLLKFHANSS
jgi:hypothetical protein